MIFRINEKDTGFFYLRVTSNALFSSRNGNVIAMWKIKLVISYIGQFKIVLPQLWLVNFRFYYQSIVPVTLSRQSKIDFHWFYLLGTNKQSPGKWFVNKFTQRLYLIIIAFTQYLQRFCDLLTSSVWMPTNFRIKIEQISAVFIHLDEI